MQHPVNQQFAVIISNPVVLELRRLVTHEYFHDIPIDRFIERRISAIMEEFLYLYLDVDGVDDDMYTLVMNELFTLINHMLPVMLIKSIECWDHDTIFIHCSPIGAKNVNPS